MNLERHSFEAYPERDEVHFLFVGRMMREKGIEELLAAAEQLAGPKVIFELLGYCDEDYQDKLEEFEKRGVIRLLGFDPDVHEYLKNCSALVLPTYHEGMSNVLMEASAAGRPVIASNISGCREILKKVLQGLDVSRKAVKI